MLPLEKQVSHARPVYRYVYTVQPTYNFYRYIIYTYIHTYMHTYIHMYSNSTYYVCIVHSHMTVHCFAAARVVEHCVDDI